MKPISEFENRVICGDCHEVMEEIPDNSVDLILTDPPYGVSYKKKGKPYMVGDTVNLFPYFLPFFRRILKNNGAVYIFSSTTKLVDVLPQFMTYFKLHSIIIWDKEIGQIPRQLSHYKLRYEPILYGSKGLHRLNEYKDDVIQQQIVRGKKRIHPTQKPEEVISYLIENSSSEFDVVLDPFLGSGTTAVACKQLNRKYIGIEINPEYCKIAEDRLLNTDPLFHQGEL